MKLKSFPSVAAGGFTGQWIFVGRKFFSTAALGDGSRFGLSP